MLEVEIGNIVINYGYLDLNLDKKAKKECNPMIYECFKRGE